MTKKICFSRQMMLYVLCAMLIHAMQFNHLFNMSVPKSNFILAS